MSPLTQYLLRNLAVDLPLSRNLLAFRRNRQLAEWKSAGKPVPPPHIVKQRIVVAYGAAFNAEVLVESGTFLGDMVYAMKDAFQSIYSIELSPGFCQLAQRRLRRFRHIHILAGDSGEVLPNLLRRISARCLFWLDGHYSGGETAKGETETPVCKEVTAILRDRRRDHVILIDDARLFNGSNGYPELETLRNLVMELRPPYSFRASNDIIRICPSANFEVEF